jgi:integrase
MALTDTFTRQAKATGKPSGDKHTDGGGMYLLVKAGGKYWRMAYRFAGKQKTLALGVYPAVSLAQARKKRDLARELLAAGTDPGVAKIDGKRATVEASGHTFEAVALSWLAKAGPVMTRDTLTQRRTWITRYAGPFIGKMPVGTIKPRDVRLMLAKIEGLGTIDTAHRVKQFCGQVFRHAVALGLADRDVTVDLKGSLAHRTTRHRPAITDPIKLGELLRAIDGYTGHPYTRAALKLAPIVMLRPGELRAAEWAEIDLDAAQWSIPAGRMKMRIAHVVPLPRQAVEVLRSLHPITGHGRFVFPSLRTSTRPLSENTLSAALKAMGYSAEVHSAHGFRATARTILDEVMNERVDLIEHQQAHAVRDTNGRAYNRTAHLAARREMLQRWSDYLDKLRRGADVIELPRTA